VVQHIDSGMWERAWFSKSTVDVPCDGGCAWFSKSTVGCAMRRGVCMVQQIDGGMGHVMEYVVQQIDGGTCHVMGSRAWSSKSTVGCAM
jgi:hypothetical protein